MPTSPGSTGVGASATFIACRPADSSKAIGEPAVTDSLTSSSRTPVKPDHWAYCSACERALSNAALRACARAAEAGVWLLIGSLALKTDDPDGRFANRSFLIGPDGGIVARYDKIHMFDVDVSPEETYRESDGFRPGDRAVVADMPLGKLGMTICYDVRFPHLHRALAQAGATILTVPAAFSYVTGAAHWEVLLRARAIETGCFVLAPAQTGTHAATSGRTRQTHGHSMVVAPWGEVLADGGVEPGIVMVDLDPDAVAQARRRVPSLRHDRAFDGP